MFVFSLKAKHGYIYILLYCNCIHTAKCIYTSSDFFCNFKNQNWRNKSLVTLSLPEFSQCKISSLSIGLFYFWFCFFLPEICLEPGMGKGRTAQWKCIMLHTLSPPFLTLKQYRSVCYRSAYVGLGFSNIFILDVRLARCNFFRFLRKSPRL